MKPAFSLVRFSKNLKLPFLVSVFVLIANMSIYSQPQNEASQAANRHLVVTKNSSNQQVKQLFVGDKVRLKLTDLSKVKGIIVSIDSSFFIVSNKQISYDEVMKFSTRKGWVQGVGAGLAFFGLMITGAQTAADSAIYYFSDEDEISAGPILAGLAATGVGVAMMLPNYRDSAKFSFRVVDGHKNSVSRNQ